MNDSHKDKLWKIKAKLRILFAEQDRLREERNSLLRRQAWLLNALALLKRKKQNDTP